MDHHEAFLATQTAKKASRTKRKRVLKKTRRNNDIAGYLDMLCCTGVTVLFWFGHPAFGVIAFVTLWLPCFFDITLHTITRPPWTTVKGDSDCPVCHGRYFLSQGFLTYWLGWKECSCESRREFNISKKEIV